MEVSEMAFPAREIIDGRELGAWRIDCVEELRGSMYVVADSLTAYSAVSERRALALSTRSSSRSCQQCHRTMSISEKA